MSLRTRVRTAHRSAARTRVSLRSGEVKYTMKGAPMNVLICHCQDCREAHGSPMSTVFLCSADQVEITGPIGEYDRRGQNKRTFCTKCGTPMCSNLYKAGLYAFFVPSIRSGDVGPPGSHIYLNEKAPEVELSPSDDLPKFGLGPGSDPWTGA